MRASLLVLLAALALLPQAGPTLPSRSMTADVDRLVRAAEKLTGSWPKQAPPPIPEVALVARHGTRVVPLLLALLSDDPGAERDPKRWKVQQQAALALCRVYSESDHCGRAYCDGDNPERIAHVKDGWLAKIASVAELQARSSSDLIARFKQETLFSRQFEIGQALAARGDRDAVRELEPLLTHDDRHLRGNAAFVVARLGDPRGFDTVAQILTDRSPRSAAERWSLEAQVRADRYYAAHLLGDLKDPRGVPLLIPLLEDKDVNDVVPWTLAQIGDRRAVGPLLQVLERDDPSMRVIAIHALEGLNAGEALPRLRELLQDDGRSNFSELLTVAEAARHAIAMIKPAGSPARGNTGLSAGSLGRSGDQGNRAGPPPPCVAGDACCRSAMVGFCRVGCPEPHTLPVPISRPAPDVSTLARPLPAGVAILEIGIDKDGLVVSACVLRSVRDDFDSAAQAAALRSRWKPLLLKGQPIGAVITVTVPTPDKAGGRAPR